MAAGNSDEVRRPLNIAAAHAPAPYHVVSAVSLTMTSPTILVVDDSASCRTELEELLRRNGFRPILAASGDEGTRLAKRCHPDVTIVDLALPDIGGVELCRQWQADPALTDLPVLLISGERTDGEQRAEGFRCGARGYLAKPFSETGLLAQIRLLHQLRQTHEQLLRRNRDLEASNQELQQFAYVVSHDLKEPLRTVTSYCQLLQRRYSDQLNAEAGQCIDFAVEGARRMRSFIDALLTYSRVGRLEPRFEPVDLENLLGRVIAGLRKVIDEKRAVIHIDPLPIVLGNPNMLAQLLQNLTENALRFAGESKPQIRFYGETQGSYCRIAVADRGIGIPSQHTERVFGVFTRLHTRDEYPGTGIGLAVCRKIIDRHGGRIWVESAPGEGTTFYFVLRSAAAIAADQLPRDPEGTELRRDDAAHLRRSQLRRSDVAEKAHGPRASEPFGLVSRSDDLRK